MAENYKHLYEQMKKMVAMYQDEIVPGMREQLEKRVEVVRCKDCKHLKYGYQCYNPLGMNLNNDGDAYVIVAEDDFCSCGERREENGC